MQTCQLHCFIHHLWDKCVTSKYRVGIPIKDRKKNKQWERNTLAIKFWTHHPLIWPMQCVPSARILTSHFHHVSPSREASGTLVTSLTKEYILFIDTDQGPKNKITLQSKGPSAFQMFAMAGSVPYKKHLRRFSAISTQVFLVFLGPRRKCWDGSHFSSKLPLHASHVALPN